MPEYEPTISVDQAAQAVYLQFTEKEVVRTEIVTDLTLIDYDKQNEIVGVELIDAIEAFVPKS